MSNSRTDQFPVGGIVCSASMLNEAEGWLLCDGRLLNQSEYSELYKAIKDLYTKEPGNGQFNIPNYLGQFLRGAPNKSDADPDKDFRKIINKNNSDTTEVGTTQEYATTKPKGEPFRATANHLPKSTHVTHGETAPGHTGPGGSINQKTCTSGGDKESRPINIYLAMYIKSKS